MTLDTSVLYDGLVDGPSSELARRFLSATTSLRAPDLIEIEMAGALTRSVRQRRLTREAAETAFRRARRIGPELDATRPLLERALALSLELAHPAADCVFLAHAESQRLVLVTSDERFSRKLAPTIYARLVVNLSEWRP